MRGILEEYSLFGMDEFYILEGFSAAFVDALSIPSKVYVVAEVDNGELEAPNFSYREKRGLLRSLKDQLNLRYSLRELMGLDWSGVRDYWEVELLLRKATTAAWSLVELEKCLSESAYGNLLVMLKRGQIKEVLAIKRRYGDAWFVKALGKQLTQLFAYKSLQVLNQESQAVDLLDLSGYRLREVEEAAKTLSVQDIEIMVDALVTKDKKLRSSSLVSDLFVLNCPISIRKR